MAVHTNIEGCLSSGQTELPHSRLKFFQCSLGEREAFLFSVGENKELGAWIPGRGVWPMALLSVGVRLALERDGRPEGCAGRRQAGHPGHRSVALGEFIGSLLQLGFFFFK